jgi:hypothetical protein
MFDFIRVMAEYVEDDVILTTLAELVNARVFSSRSARAEELAQRVVGSDADRSPETRAAFRDALKELPRDESIEVLLEAAASSQHISAGSTDLRFRYAINRVFFLIDWTFNWSPLERFLRFQLSRADTTHTFVDFNYDLVFDHALEPFPELWAVQSGYGFPIPFYSIRENLGPTADYPTVHDAEPFVGELPSSVLLLKPHGSLNWLLPYRSRNGGWRYDERPVMVPLTDSGNLRYISSAATFQEADIPNEMRISNVQPLIIPPTYDKLTDLPFLLNIRAQADRALQEADEVYILGWSMPSTDMDHQARIERITRQRNKPIERLALVSRNMAPDDVARIARTFNMASSELHNESFVEFVNKTIT